MTRRGAHPTAPAGGRSAGRARSAAEAALAAAALGAAVLWASWPLAASATRDLADPLAVHGRVELWTRADLDLVTWALAWVAHALATDPAHLFDANLFHPAPNALASSESFLGLAPIAAPVFLASGSAALAHNVTMLAVVWLTGLTTFWTVRAWTGDAAAGLLAGIALALSPYSVGGWVRLHWSAFSLLPLLLLLSRRAAASPRAPVLAALAVATALQLLAGMYLAFQTAAALACFLPAVLWEARRQRRRPYGALAALAAGAVPLALIAPRYLTASGAAGGAESAGDLDAALAVVRLTAETPAALAGRLVADLSWPVLVFAAFGALPKGRGDGHVRLALVAMAAVGFALACGPELPLPGGATVPGPYRLAMEVVPGFARMRTSVRFLAVPLVALAVLGGLGAADLARVLATRSAAAGRVGRAALVVGAVALLVHRTPADRVALAPALPDGPEAELHAWLREQRDGGAVLDVPVPTTPMDFERVLATGRAMVGSTLHWHPLVNGYSGHPPESARLLLALARRLPDPRAFADLRALAAPRYLVLRTDLLLSEKPWEGAAERLGLREAARFGPIVVYAAPPGGDLTAALLEEIADGPGATTLRGVPLAPLPPAAMRGRVDALLGSPFSGGALVRVANESPHAWPGLTTASRGRVAVAARWIDLASGEVHRADPPVPLGSDVAPGERVHLVLTSLPPRRPGRYRLEIGLVQEGLGWFADRAGTGSFHAELTIEADGRASAAAAPAAGASAAQEPEQMHTPAARMATGPAGC